MNGILGYGNLRNYKYWTGGIILTTKAAVKEGMKLRLRILRQNKETKEVMEFNYNTNGFVKLSN